MQRFTQRVPPPAAAISLALQCAMFLGGVGPLVVGGGAVVVTDASDAATAAEVEAAPAKVDADGDGLDDADERAWADEYFPFYAIHPSDGCKTHGVVYRLSPHPADASKLAITYDVLY